MLMSPGIKMPRRVFGHGFITKEALKMGKRLGDKFDPGQLVDTYGSDAVQYYFLRAVDFGRDADFSEQRFIDVFNSDFTWNSTEPVFELDKQKFRRLVTALIRWSSDDFN